MKSYDLENSHKRMDNRQMMYGWRNDNYNRDPDAEMLRRAQQADDYHRAWDYKNTGAQTEVDTYTQREWDNLWNQKDKEEAIRQNFIARNSPSVKGAVPPPPPKPPAQPQQYKYENFDANGKSMGFTTGVSGQSNYMQGAASVKAPNGKIYQTNSGSSNSSNRSSQIKSQPAITTASNLNNFKQTISSRSPQKVAPTVSSRSPQKVAPTVSSVVSSPKPAQSFASAVVSKVGSTLKDKLLSSLRK